MPHSLYCRHEVTSKKSCFCPGRKWNNVRLGPGYVLLLFLRQSFGQWGKSIAAAASKVWKKYTYTHIKVLVVECDKKEILTTNSCRRIGRGKTCRLTRPPLLQFFPIFFFPQRVAWEKFSSLIPRLQFSSTKSRDTPRSTATIWRSIKLTNQKMQYFTTHNVRVT